MTESAAKVDHEPPSSPVAAVREVSTGSSTPESTSQNRKSRMPMATALRNAFNRGTGARRRPMGRPRKIVKPAMAPSRTIWPEDMSGR